MSFDEDTYETLKVTVEDGVCFVTFSRPERYNSITGAVMTELTEVLKSAAGDDRVRVVVLTGTGKYYSSGYDVTETDLGNNERFRQLVQTLIRFKKILMVGVNGHAVGMSVSSMALADLVYCTPRATFRTPFMQVALVPEACSSALFPAILGMKAMDLLVAGSQWDAVKAEQTGLVTGIVPEDGFYEELSRRAKRIASYLPGTLLACKELVRPPRRMEELETINNREVERLEQQIESGESAMAIMAMMEERRRQKSKL